MIAGHLQGIVHTLQQLNVINGNQGAVSVPKKKHILRVCYLIIQK